MKTITKIYPMVTPWGTGVFIPVSHELDIKKDAEYSVEIKKPFKKRTLDANVVCLCRRCHEQAHGVNAKLWRERFLNYLKEVEL